jgi:glycosyltransferase involved in cell wall biosynthesis
MPGTHRSPRLVSVIVPVRNDAVVLEAQLECLETQRYEGDWEVIIVDNGSSDGSGALARSWAERLPRQTVVDTSAGRGASHARNAGAAAAHGDFLAFCDADDEVSPGWLAAIAGAARDYDIVGGWIDRDALNPGVEREWRPWHDAKDHLPVALGFRPYVLAGNCGIWRHALERIGSWNEAYQACTDVELSWRAQRAGYRLGFAPEAAVRYRYRSTIRETARQFFRLGKAEAQLYRDFRTDGLPRSIAQALRGWAWIVVNVPRAAFSLESRGFWVRSTARRLGRLVGSLEKRVVFP